MPTADQIERAEQKAERMEQILANLPTIMEYSGVYTTMIPKVMELIDYLCQMEPPIEINSGWKWTKPSKETK
jgi:hypothetical protein